MAKTLLVHFISDFLRDNDLQERVVKNPRAALLRYGLNGRQIAILRSLDEKRIKDAIIKELAHATRRIVREYTEV
jgi:hypothetical protein